MIRVLVVDDHTILRQGIAGLLRPAAGIEVVAEAGTGEEAVLLARELTPDIIIMDITLPGIDGLEAARRIRAQGGESRVIFLTMHHEPGLCKAALRDGGQGFLLKDDALDDLLAAIAAVAGGATFVSESLRTERQSEAAPPLSPRESEVVSLIAAGCTSREIAARLFISPKTVEVHRANIMAKLGVKNVAELVGCAYNSGLVR